MPQHRPRKRGNSTTAFATIKGFEVMRALKKGQGSLFRYLPGVAGEVCLVHRAFGLV